MIIGIDISVLNDEKRTGIAVYVYELIKALLSLNKKDTFILFAFTPLATYKYIKNLEFKKYPNVKMKIFKMPSKVFRRVFLLWQKIDFPPVDLLIGKVDVFHSFNWYLPPLKNGKIVATVFDLTSIIYPKWHHDKTTELDKIRFERISKYADQVITISENTKKDFQKISLHPKIEVIYPAASDTFKKNISNINLKKILNKYSLKAGYFLSVATMEPRKNIVNLIKAFNLSKVNKKLVLIGGSGWKNKQVLKLISKNKKNITNLGFVTSGDLPYLYKGATALIYPSFYEGFGIPVLEAMSIGINVITSNNSSLPEVGGEGGYYINPRNIKDISNAIKKISKDKSLSEKLKRKGFIQAKKFSWQKSARSLNNLYQEIGR